jgi:hypothetical protein
MPDMKKIATLLFALMLFAGNAYAETIASWDMYGLTGTETYVTGVGFAAADAYDMVRGDGLIGNTGSNSFNSKGWNGANADDYIEFGFEVASGYEVTLSELWLGSKSSATGPGTIGVYTSLDNFTTAIYSIALDGSNYSNVIVDLSGLGTITGSFYLRLMEIGDTQADGDGATYSTGTFRITDYYSSGTYTDVQFTGSTSAVPVPGAFLLFGSGMTLLGAIRRKLA